MIDAEGTKDKSKLTSINKNSKEKSCVIKIFDAVGICIHGLKSINNGAAIEVLIMELTLHIEIFVIL